ncbi:MAG TPA: DedA family protein [Gammaproteobacteria bacterium]|nr:DedA family protein [Gammaproteobacteria bacterium]
MAGRLLAALAGFITAIIGSLGYGGVVLLMAIESACIPLPSEVTLPFAGYLVFKGELSLWGVALAGAVGCVLGSLLAYAVGAWGGRPLVAKYGRYLLISHRDLTLAERWFARHGDITIFVGRLLPVVRTFIAFPAGVARMGLGKFVVYSFLGSLIWCWALASIGARLGEHWDSLGTYFHRFDALILAVIMGVGGWWVWRHWRHLKGGKTQD